VERVVRARRIQGFFRGAVLAAYEYRCALSGLAIPKLLIASHIVPWKDSPELRADPRNGICLNALYDRAFDRGLITFDEALHVIVSPAIRDLTDETGKALFRGIEDAQLRKPAAFAPDVTALRYHRERVFGG
jgi:predicted restriction endonuclease